jgi:hypothetical protein
MLEIMSIEAYSQIPMESKNPDPILFSRDGRAAAELLA